MTDETITHPIQKGTKIKYLQPKCPCVGKGYQLKVGVVTAVINKNHKFFYNITTTKHRIPEAGVVKIL